MDLVLENLNKDNDLQAVDNALHVLLGMHRLSVFAIAKLVWGTKKWWIDREWDEESGDTFEDHFDATHNLKRLQLDRYVMVWDHRDEMPKEIHTRPLKDQIAIAQALSQGFNISKEDWKKLVQAANNSEILGILRKVKGKPPRKSYLNIRMERDGSVYGWDSDGGRHYLGFLNIKEENDDEYIKKGISRITKNSGIDRR